MVLLVTETDVKDRLMNVQGITIPTGLTLARTESYITGISAMVLERMGLTAAPAAGLELDNVKEVTTQLVCLKIRMDYFGLDGAAMEALSKQWSQVWGTIPLSEQLQGTAGGVGIETWGGT